MELSVCEQMAVVYGLKAEAEKWDEARERAAVSDAGRSVYGSLADAARGALLKMQRAGLVYVAERTS